MTFIFLPSKHLARTLALWAVLLCTACAPVVATPAPTPGNGTPAGAQQPSPAPTRAQTPTAVSPTAALSPAPESTATPAPAQHAAYTLSLQFDYAQHSAVVKEAIHYPNTSGESLPGLSLAVEPNTHSGAFVLDSLSLDGGQPTTNYQLAGNRLDIPLDQALAAGQSVDVSLEYELHLPAIPPPTESIYPVAFGYSSRQTNLVDWFPFFPPYRAGQGWLIHDPWYYGEHQVYDVAAYQVDVQLSSQDAGLVVAASAPATQDGDQHHYQVDLARTFVLSFSPQYKVDTLQVGNVLVESYTFPLDQKAGQAALQETGKAVALYSQLFAPYPHATLSVVEGDFMDGMEYDGLYFLSRGFYSTYDGSPQSYLTTIAAHETAHQWWFGLVGNDQALEPWLDEALSTYTESLFYEKTYPQEVSWWWSFRVNYYQPQGWINHPINGYASYVDYRNAVYLRGAQFLEAVRKQMGDEAFFAFLKDYAAQFSHKQASGQDFFALLAQHSSQDLQGVIATYFDPSVTAP